MRVRNVLGVAPLIAALGLVAATACDENRGQQQTKAGREQGVGGARAGDRRGSAGDEAAAAKDHTEWVRGDSSGRAGSPTTDQAGRPTRQVGQPATGEQPGSLAGPAAQQDTAAGGSPGPEVVVNGRLVEASADAIVIDAPNKHGLRLKIGSDTAVKLNGQKSTPAELITGAEIRAAYKVQDGQPVATRVDGTSNKGELRPAEQMKKP